MDIFVQCPVNRAVLYVAKPTKEDGSDGTDSIDGVLHGALESGEGSITDGGADPSAPNKLHVLFVPPARVSPRDADGNMIPDVLVVSGDGDPSAGVSILTIRVVVEMIPEGAVALNGGANLVARPA